MARHNDIGRNGEQLAAGWLTTQGHIILHRNWRYRRAEIDIISSYREVIYFTEVKTATSLRFGYPEQRIGKRKYQQLFLGIQAFLEKYPVDKHATNVLSVYTYRHRTTYFTIPINFIFY